MRCEISNKWLSIKIPFVVKWHSNQWLFFSNSSLNKFTFLAKIALKAELDFVFYDYNSLPFFCWGRNKETEGQVEGFKTFERMEKFCKGEELIGFWVYKEDWQREERERDFLTGRERQEEREEKETIVCDCTQELKSPPTTNNQEFSWRLDCQDFVRIRLKEK